jgi:hypothetical protein
LTSFYDWRALEWLGVQLPNLPEKHYSNTPLALSLRALFDHVTGVAPAPETVRDACQRVCEALFVAARVAGREYTIPAEFWETLTGQAIRAAFGGSPEIGDEAEITGEQAAQLAGVSRETIRLWREAGKLTAVREGGSGGAFWYRAGDVRRVARER